ncbi:MAG: hypothetical protein V4735_09630 [Pseudomonadota bacterium]
MKWIAPILILTTGFAAAAATPLPASDTAGLQNYCSTMYAQNHYPAEKKEAYCACFVTGAAQFDPVTRSVLALLGADPAIGPETRQKIDALAASLSDAEARRLSVEVKSSAAALKEKCSKTLGWRRFF